MKPVFRILLCDDHETLRSRCREMLSQAPDLEIVGEAAGGYAGVEMALALVPDLVLMDVDMPDLNGIEATRRILARKPDIKVLAHSAGSGWHVVREMLFAGASGYLVKGGDPDELAEAIRVVLAGDRFLSGRIKLPLLSPLAPQHGANIGGGPGLSAAAAVQVALVDDSSIVRQRLAGLLSTQEGVALAGQAADVAAGLALLRERKVDVLVSGLHLREESGLDLIQIAKQENASLIAVILTDYDHPRLRQRSASLGADFCFHKPTEVEKVLEVCRDLVNTRGLSRWLATLQAERNGTDA